MKAHLSYSNEQLLVCEIISDNEDAFRKLFEMYKTDIYVYSISMVKDRFYAEEIVQDVFLKVWLNRKKLDPQLSVRSYIFTITKNLTLNFLRKAANDHKMCQEVFYKGEKSHNPTEDLLSQKFCKQLRKEAIQQLPPKRKQIFIMSREEELSYQEIGTKMGISVSTVKTHMTKALQSIREFFVLHGDISFVLCSISLNLFL